jgi:hypothetical protein
MRFKAEGKQIQRLNSRKAQQLNSHMMFGLPKSTQWVNLMVADNAI